jgi:membrane-bound metal-dependent hydrolase YbcI (DUF457 family)
MFLGHYGLALAAKRVSPRTSLGTLAFAAQLLDEIWPVLLLLGVERVRIVPGLMAANALDLVHYPISHSLLTAVGWSVLVGGVHFARRRDARAALVLGGLVLSHWLLDALMHRPDLPLWPGSATRVGLGMWNSIPITLLLEGTLLLAGVISYVRTTRPLDRTGRWAFWSFVALLIVFFASSLLGPPPGSERALAYSALGLWLFVPWTWWIDRHREPRVGRERPATLG